MADSVGKRAPDDEFARWFEGSKVVDERGAPLALYADGSRVDGKPRSGSAGGAGAEPLPIALARRTLVQAEPFTPAQAADQAGALVPQVRELARGFEVSASEASQALLRQQVGLAADVDALFEGDEEMALAAQQIRAKANGEAGPGAAADRQRTA